MTHLLSYECFHCSSRISFLIFICFLAIFLCPLFTISSYYSVFPRLWRVVSLQYFSVPSSLYHHIILCFPDSGEWFLAIFLCSLFTISSYYSVFLGWESQILESGFLAIFLCPLFSISALPRFTPTSMLGIYGYRWFIFRIMLGAVRDHICQTVIFDKNTSCIFQRIILWIQ